MKIRLINLFFLPKRYTNGGFLTRERYPNIKRGDYAIVKDNHLKEFEEILGKTRVITDLHEVSQYNVDWLRSVTGESKIVLKPKSSEELSHIMRICHREKIAVCPQGGNTGLVAGSVPVFDEVIISLSSMDKIHWIDKLEGTIKCESGCVLYKLDKALNKEGLMMPLDLGSKGKCQIGGNISTCAGGLRLLRYGSMHANILGLEVVEADGTILNMMNSLRKDNTAYHLKQYFIGSEGTLGIVTKAVVHCPLRPTSIHLAFIGLPNYQSVLSTYSIAKVKLMETLSSCEMIDEQSFEYVLALGIESPFTTKYPFYMVVETHGSFEEHDKIKMELFLKEIHKSGHALDSTYTSEPSKILLRERILHAMSKTGSYVMIYDIGLPLNKFYEIISVMKKQLSEFGQNIDITGYGHLGDGNIHLNIICDGYDQKILDKVEPFIYEWTSHAGGSIAAEHGIGFKNVKNLHYSKSFETISLMKHIKRALDPKGILNPYKVLPVK